MLELQSISSLVIFEPKCATFLISSFAAILKQDTNVRKLVGMAQSFATRGELTVLVS